MSKIRGLLALILLPFMLMVPATSADAHSRIHGTEYCAAPTEEMDMMFIRLHPTNYARIEKSVRPGECGIDVTGRCHEGWCPVVQGRFDGWMHKDQLAPMSAAVYCVGRVDAGWTLDIHEGPSRSTRIVASLHDSYCGISLTPFKQGHWIRVKAAGAYGWVSETNIR